MTARRLTMLGAYAGLVVLLGWALEGWSAKSPPMPCPAGRFLVDPGNGQLVQGASPGSVDSVTVDGQSRVSIGSGCLAVVGHVMAKRHFTKLTVNWPSCGSAGSGHLKAKITSPDCGVMTGRFKTKGGKVKPFTARRSTCGDGIVDEPGGEQCEPAVGGCPGDTQCTAVCTCESPPTTTVTTSTIGTATTLETTTTTVTSSTTTTTTGYTCGAASSPACNGTCPDGRRCRPVLRLGGCTCAEIIALTTTTTSITTTTIYTCSLGFSQYGGQCGGSCPPGYTCWDGDAFCFCVHFGGCTPSTDADGNITCGGSCDFGICDMSTGACACEY